MLARDETIELHTVLQDADVEYAEQDKASLRVFPVRRDELFAYDVIILGDVNPALLSAASLQNLADFVDQPGKGGAWSCWPGRSTCRWPIATRRWRGCCPSTSAA